MFKKVLIASAMLAAVAGANAQSTGFGVGGTVTPSTCSISLTGAGIADYGGLTKVAVQATSQGTGSGGAYYALGNRTVALSVSCSSPIRLELATVDNKAAQKFAIDANDGFRYGIANGTNTTAFGAYVVSGSVLTLNGATPATFLTAPTGTTAWSATGFNGEAATTMAPGYATGFSATAAATIPDAVTTIGGNLTFTSYISKAVIDAATGVVTLNGSGTISLQYL